MHHRHGRILAMLAPSYRRASPAKCIVVVINERVRAYREGDNLQACMLTHLCVNEWLFLTLPLG